MPTAAVIFDFDGVIADTEHLHLGAFREAFTERGWTLDEADYFDRYVGFDDRGLIVAYTDDLGIKLAAEELAALLAAKRAAFGRHLSASVVYPGAHAVIERIAGRYPVGIASGALHHEIAAILKAANLSEWFPVIVGADDVKASKPSPDPYLAAAAGLLVNPSDCVAIEDSVTGLQAAHSAGMRTIAVTTTAPGHLLAIADRVVSGLEEITPDLVAELGAPAALW